MRILGIETSCDETAAAVVEDGTHVLSNVIATSKQAFEFSGGVIPEHAARRQVECMIPVLIQALKEARTNVGDIDVIAVTKEPGLLGSLLVGTTTARTLASVWKKPLVEVNHTLGHLSSTLLQEPKSYKLPIRPAQGRQAKSSPPHFPLLALSVSGGHTELWYRESHTRGKLLGQTRDDAAGEAFDKGAALLGLPYPGGPAIAKVATGGDESAYKFPLPLKEEKTLDFSFSGLKTALKYRLQEMKNVKCKMKNVAAAYQHAICLHLVDRLKHAYQQYPDIHEIHVVGGVSANTHLRTLLIHTIPNVPTRFPLSLTYCTDNAAMIAGAAYVILTEQCSPRSITT